jgi:DNA polymerase I-like protein with 3'-5' exonuclease and polymerase domains
MIETLYAIDIETTPVDDITNDIEKIWCICWACKWDGKVVTEEIVFPDGITKNDLALKKVSDDIKPKLYDLQSILNNENGRVPVFHAAQFEYRHLTEAGFSIKKFHDTILLGYVLYPRYESLSLEAWGKRKYCDVKTYADVDVHEFFGSFKQEIVERCKADVISTLQLVVRLKDELRQDKRAYDLYENIEIPFVPILVEMNRNGSHIDPDKLTEFTIEVEQELENARNAIWSICPVAPGKSSKRLTPVSESKLATATEKGGLEPTEIGKYIFMGKKWFYDNNLEMERPYNVYRRIETFNPASPDQKIWALATYDGYISEDVSEKTGKPKTDKFSLEQAAANGSKLADALLNFQTINKLYTSFCVPLQNMRHTNSRIYAEFFNFITATGRLSCRNPNLQQIPIRNELGAKLRNCVTPEHKDYVIVDIDLSGAEMRILAWYLVKLLGDEYEDAWLLWNAAQRGQDLHKPTIDQLGLDPDKERIVAKTLSFGDMYGMGTVKFARTLRCTMVKAKEYLALRHDRMPSIVAMKELVWELCRNRDDHTIHTLYGRRLTYHDIVDSDGAKRSRAERQVFNALIQGTQGDILKILMIEAIGYIKEAGAWLLMQVHDELVIECPKATADWLCDKLTSLFTNTDLLPGLPLVGEAKIGDSWGDAK